MAKASQNTTTRASVGLPISCPEWCEDRGRGCRGEHYASGDYIPATAGHPRKGAHHAGVWFPCIGPAVVWNTIDGRPPAVSIHLNGEGVDVEADMQLHEAKALLKSLKRAIRTLEGR